MSTTRQLETVTLFNFLYTQLICKPLLIEGFTLFMPPGWTLHFDNNKSAAGRCHYLKNKITISNDYIHSSTTTLTDIVDTLLHEMAHVIAGPMAEHGPIWKLVAKTIGCTADVYCKRFIFEKDYKYVIKCPMGCKKHRHRLAVDKHIMCRTHNVEQEIIVQK